jgi:class 3 adenylate cyclase
VAALRALALIYDIRGFTAASKRLGTADLGAFATGAHRVILDLFAPRPPTFVKNLGDGHLLLWECAEDAAPDPELVKAVVVGAQRARTAFAAFATQQRAAGLDIPGHVGIGVAFGEVSRSDDYYGRALNLASRLQNEARPEGLALDATVFDTVASREAALRERFKKARVRLKGLGSTLVWVDRPFSWARALAPVLKAAAVIAVPLAYLLLCDAGVALPGGDGVRDLLDARSITLFRAPVEDAEVRRTADAQRRRLFDAIVANRTPSGWVHGSFPVPAPTPEQAAIKAEERAREEQVVDVWSGSQATYALLKAPQASPEAVLRDVLRYLDVLFERAAPVEVDGVAWGLRPNGGADHTRAEPTLWTVAATAASLARPGLLVGESRTRMAERLQRAQAGAMAFRPLDTGAWNTLPRQTLLRRHSPYTTTLALLALLEVRAAGEPWQGSVPTRDRLIAETAGFLARTYEAHATTPGWRRTCEASDKVSIGLTMQALAMLLRAEAEAGVALPRELLAAIPTHLVERGRSRATDDYDMGEFKEQFTRHDGQTVELIEGINFLSHPWAVDAAARWLERARARGAEPGDVVRVRRALGQLVVEMGEEAVARALEGYTFVASESLVGLSAVPLPEAP